MSGSPCGRVRADCFIWLGLGLLAANFQPAVAQNAAGLLAATRPVRDMSEAELLRLVPLQSGLQYVGCPHCDAGRQERQLEWSIDRPEVVQCAFCQHVYPSDEYPMNKAVEVRTPRGGSARFPYWEDDSGYRYFFLARRDDEVRRYLSRQTLNLAELYVVSRDQTHARRAALLLDRIAQVFPHWCYHYDYPFQQKVIYDGDVSPADFRDGYRTARWNWWAYSDIPGDLVEAYRILKPSGIFEQLTQELGVNVPERIEQDLLRNAGDQVLANRDDLTNMSPTAWESLVRLGKVIGEPRYVHEVVRRFRRMIDSGFLYDGFWHEGAPSYGEQTVGNLRDVLRTLHGYTDPPGYVDPVDGIRFDALDMNAEFPLLGQARRVLDRMRFPSGRAVPVHDTWAGHERDRKPVADWSPYLIPALGHACLGGGDGFQRAETHLSWSGGYGHQHADVLSLLLFGNGREVLSDLGYTHTAYRSWTLATAAHNTVVIDGLSQAPGSVRAPTDGRLRFIDWQNRNIQVVSADGTRAYPNLASTYQRTLVAISSGAKLLYVVDVFEVEGGRTHDYFLHGDADGSASALTDVALQDRATLLPAGFDWKPTANEGQSGRSFEPHYAYGFLNRLRSAKIDTSSPVDVRFLSDAEPRAGVRVILFPEPDSELVLGENPSIRQAQEDDAHLSRFQRPFLMLRHVTGNGRSRFVSLIEPCNSEPVIQSVERLETGNGSTALLVRHGQRRDLVVLGAATEQSVVVSGDPSQTARFQGELGVLTLVGGKVEQAYITGEGQWTAGKFRLTCPAPQRAALTSVKSSILTISYAGTQLPVVGSVLKLVTADGWVYPYHVSDVQSVPGSDRFEVSVVEGPGFEYSAETDRMKFRSFPQREHSGPVFIEWQPVAAFPTASQN